MCVVLRNLIIIRAKLTHLHMFIYFFSQNYRIFEFMGGVLIYATVACGSSNQKFN